MHSISVENRSFLIVLGVIFALHAAIMMVKVRDEVSTAITSIPKVIRLKLSEENSKNLQTVTAAKKQIVQTEDSTTETKPTEKAFLGEKDRSFDRQTVAKEIAIFKKAGVGNASNTQIAKKVSPTSSKKPSLKDLKLSDVGIEAIPPTPVNPNRQPASESVKGKENGDPMSEGFSSTNDYVQEVALGDFTQLNTVEYKFYGFYHRIRQKLEQFWGKTLQEKANNLFRSGRRIASSGDLITSLQITLNEQGQITGVKVLGTSGVKELDDAAIESFNQAGPFPNPPKDLLVNGKAVIEWGFVVKS